MVVDVDVERCFCGMVPSVGRLARIQQIVKKEMISKPRFNNTFDYFGNKRKVRDWTVIRKLLVV